MLGKRSSQRGMFEADQQYLDFVGEDAFYGFLARHGYDLFRDEGFAELYCHDNGRRSVPPSLLALALLLQAYDRVSDVEAMTCTCPAGQVTDKLVGAGRWTDRHGVSHRKQAFQFDTTVCDPYPLREQCTRAAPGKGRTVAVHPQERLLQEAQALQNSLEFKRYQRQRQTVEHRLARLVQLGSRQARYFGRTKTLFQALIAATVANLTPVAGKTGEMGGALANNVRFAPLGAALQAVHRFMKALVRQIRQAITSRLPSPVASQRPDFRPGF